MSNIPKISDSEWQVMKIIWANTPCTANQVVEALSETKWQPKTIKTLINRLVKKSVLSYKVDEQDKKTYHYFPMVMENECIKAESQSFIKRVFNGSLNAMLANFLSESELSSDEIDELKRILDKRKD
ncbi:BlaI/MecI/CopY family transcriptional regulator [Clostridium ganghwense]|uniref:BlaI/MecI/CopY family transcriptional regulator n=1 Tax=Clostridium ganghwense TaxID=312089 RepID=A0ABT4CNA7_9CLOT|nr:BlaI/MecI/CopY family transcriptional regulator [Clostridium ganghwense]MCY6369479.1 BlaI/MecI/CopY family transcriptional regulator [Clostridium ganghwense]